MVGANVTLTWQGVCVAHVPAENGKSAGSKLLGSTETITGSLLGAVTVNVCAALLAPTAVFPKTREFGVAIGGLGYPVPPRFTVCCVPEVVSVTVSVAVRSP